MNFQRSRDSYFMGTHKCIYGDEIVALLYHPLVNKYSVAISLRMVCIEFPLFKTTASELLQNLISLSRYSIFKMLL